MHTFHNCYIQQSVVVFWTQTKNTDQQSFSKHTQRLLNSPICDNEVSPTWVFFRRFLIILWHYMAVNAHICTIFQHNQFHYSDEHLDVWPLGNTSCQWLFDILCGPEKGHFITNFSLPALPIVLDQAASAPTNGFLGSRTCIFTNSHTPHSLQPQRWRQHIPPKCWQFCQPRSGLSAWGNWSFPLK